MVELSMNLSFMKIFNFKLFANMRARRRADHRQRADGRLRKCREVWLGFEVFDMLLPKGDLIYSDVAGAGKHCNSSIATIFCVLFYE
jgi:hypothetical protein